MFFDSTYVILSTCAFEFHHMMTSFAHFFSLEKSVSTVSGGSHIEVSIWISYERAMGKGQL